MIQSTYVYTPGGDDSGTEPTCGAQLVALRRQYEAVHAKPAPGCAAELAALRLRLASLEAELQNLRRARLP